MQLTFPTLFKELHFFLNLRSFQIYSFFNQINLSFFEISHLYYQIFAVIIKISLLINFFLITILF